MQARLWRAAKTIPCQLSPSGNFYRGLSFKSSASGSWLGYNFVTCLQQKLEEDRLQGIPSLDDLQAPHGPCVTTCKYLRRILAPRLRLIVRWRMSGA